MLASYQLSGWYGLVGVELNPGPPFIPSRTADQFFQSNRPAEYNPEYPVKWYDDNFLRDEWHQLRLGDKGRYTEMYCATLVSQKYHSFVTLVDPDAGATGQLADVVVFCKMFEHLSTITDESQPTELPYLDDSQLNSTILSLQYMLENRQYFGPTTKTVTRTIDPINTSSTYVGVPAEPELRQ